MEQKELTIEQKLNAMRKKVRNTENVWFFCCGLSFVGTIVYLFLVYKKGILPGTPLRYMIIVAWLALIFFCIYILPIMLHKNRKYRQYSEEYKKAFVQPYLEKAFGVGSYKDNEKVSIKEIVDFSLLKKVKTAKANDCIQGIHNGIPFLRYDLTLSYESKNVSTNFVLIAVEIETGLENELQVVHDDFKLSNKEYEQPEGYAKILSGHKHFDKEYSIFAKDQKEGEKFLRDLSEKKISRKAKSFPAAIFFDHRKVYILLKRNKDVMEAPVYHRIKEGRCVKEAEMEVELIRSWIETLKECLE